MRQRILRVTLFLAVLGLVAPGSASAQYLDPGAGSILIQAILAGIVGIATFTKIYWHKIRGFVSKSQE
jgi:hypothetical protein